MPKGYRGKMSLWFYSAFVLFMVPMGSVLGANVACQEVRYQYSAQGMDVYEVPLTPQKGMSDFLGACRQAQNCIHETLLACIQEVPGSNPVLI